MPQKKTEPLQQSSERTAESPHPALKLRHTLRGHIGDVYRMTLSPNGRTLASTSQDMTVRLWDVESGQVLQILEHQENVVCVDWSPDGAMLVVGGGISDNKVYLWDASNGRLLRILQGHGGMITGVAWSPDGTILASCSIDRMIRLWDAKNGRILQEFKKPPDQIECLAWSPDGRQLCSGGWDISGTKSIRLWESGTGREIQVLSRHNSLVMCVTWSPNGHQIASSSYDKTICIWNTETAQELYLLEGHTAGVFSVSFLDNGCLLASLGGDGTVIFWQTDTWSEVLRAEKIGKIGNLSNFTNLAVHPVLPVMATPGFSENEINIWDLDLALLHSTEPVAPTMLYVNAKAVLLGESRVGKSALGIRIAEKEFRKTESTHGAQFWHFPTARLPGLPPNVQAELTLWDLAGQPEYRLTHQLFLDDTDAALLLFDGSDANDPFRGVPYWAKALKKHAPNARKFLVSSRCDVSPVTVDHPTINRTLATYGLDGYFSTSAKTGEGVTALFERLMREIPWEQLPRTSTPKLFQVAREFLLERKRTGANLIGMEEIRQATADRFTERAATQAELDTVVQLLQSRGLVHRLEPHPGAV